MSDSDRDMSEREALAAEYVLGTLPFAERLTAEALLESDVNFIAMVEDWQSKLAPLNDEFEEVAPPAAMLARIEQRLFPTQKKSRAGWVWGALAGAAVAVAAFILIVPPGTAPQGELVATLTSEEHPLVMAASYDAETRSLIVNRTAGPEAEAGRDYELWLIPAGEPPVAIGLVRGGDLSVPHDALPAGATLAITLEPEGGSPTGQPTGPILASAIIGES